MLDTLTCYENIALALTIQNVHIKEINERVEKVAARLEITDILKKYPYQVSRTVKSKELHQQELLLQTQR